jgi:hypothetical protein
VDPVSDAFRPEDWWLFHALRAGTREQRVDLERGESRDATAAWRAFDAVDDVITSGGVEAISLILELLDSAPTPAAVSAVGAGPLEDLLHEHGEQLIDEVERRARQEPAFAHALRSVWLEHGALPTEVEARLENWVQVTGRV